MAKPTFTVKLDANQMLRQLRAAWEMQDALEKTLREDPNFVMQIHDEFIMTGDKK